MNYQENYIDVMNPIVASRNHNMAGVPNPKTFVPPPMTDRMFDLEQWRTRGDITNSSVNSARPWDIYQSGYTSKPEVKDPRKINIREPNRLRQEEPVRETGGVYNLPTYEHVSSDLYTKSESFTPINSSLGISYAPQLPSVSRTNNVYTRSNDKQVEEMYREYNPSYENVYDPRLTGYGDARRCYVDKMTGQPRYMYDDVDAVTAPPYISRNKIDHLPIGESIGYNNNIDPTQLRQAVQQEWFNQTDSHRSDLMESLMRKRNEELIQLRIAPIRYH